MKPKTKIIGMFLKDFVFSYVPPQEAQTGTLGGKGYEEALWRKYGVLQTHGWLVERSHEKSKKLMRGGYRLVNELNGLPSTLAGLGEERSYLDSFHLDLDGTFKIEDIENFSPVLPLIFKGKGRCLAVTVADARQNPVLDKWPDYEKRGRKIFGDSAKEIFDKLLATQKMIPTDSREKPEFIQPFDPEKGAKREFGVLVILAELLLAHKGWLPSSMERFVYVSEYAGNFRMRTYFFRFDRSNARRPGLALARTWTKSRLRYLRRNGLIEVQSSENQTQGEKTMPKTATAAPSETPSKLKAFVEFACDEVRAEYATLVLRAAGYDDLKTEHTALVDSIRKAMNGTHMEKAPAASPGLTPGPAHAPAAHNGSNHRAPARKHPTHKRGWDDISATEQVHWLIQLLEIRMTTKRTAWDPVWREQIEAKFGRYDQDLAYKLRSLLAQYCGKLREKRKKYIEEVFGAAEAKPLIERLDKLPSKVPYDL
jgi:hypothetical protein